MHYVKEEIGDSKGAFECRMRQDKAFESPPYPSLTPLLLPLLSLSRRHLSSAGPPWVGVLSRHLCFPPPPGGPLLGQALPAAAWGPGADCQESGHLERWGGQTCLHTHPVPTHEKQTYSSFTHPSWRLPVVQGNCDCAWRFKQSFLVVLVNWFSLSFPVYKALWSVNKHLLIQTLFCSELFVFVDQVACFVKGLPGCKEHAATFKTEVRTSSQTRTLA